MQILSPEMVTLLNAEITREQTAHLHYRSGALWADDAGYFGVSHWCDRQALDELDHRNKLQKYLVKLGAKPVTPTGDAPAAAWADLPGFFEATMGLEQVVTRAIIEINAVAIATGDGLTQQRMKFYLAEQTLSIGEIADIQKLFARFGVQGASLALIDKRIGKL